MIMAGIIKDHKNRCINLDCFCQNLNNIENSKNIKINTNINNNLNTNTNTNTNINNNIHTNIHKNINFKN